MEHKQIKANLLKAGVENLKDSKTVNIGMDFFIQRVKNKATKISMFEKICLLFVKAKFQVDPYEQITIVYKVFNKRLFIINQFKTQRTWMCRHEFRKFTI